MIPVVLAPGLLCDDRLWSAVTPLLAGPVMTVDFAEDDTIEAMAERILAEGPSRFVLAGFSMGGMAAVVAAARAPERIVGLVLIDTHAEPETPDRSERRARQIATADAGGFARLVREELKPVYFAEPEAHADERRLVSNMALEAVVLDRDGPHAHGATIGRSSAAGGLAGEEVGELFQILGRATRAVAAEAAEPILYIGGVGDLAHLPVRDHVQSRLDLTGHGSRDGLGDHRFEGGGVEDGILALTRE